MFDVIISTFISPNIFWIIEKKDILLRNSFQRYLKKVKNPEIDDYDYYYENSKLIVVNVNNVWARAIIYNKFNEGEENRNINFLCWLVDYGVMSCVKKIYQLPNWMIDIPHFAKQAGLYGFVNTKTELVQTDDCDLEMVQINSIEPTEGVRNLAKKYLDRSNKLQFDLFLEKDGVLFGEIICLGDEESYTLTNYLLEQNAIVQDKVLFEEANTQRGRHCEEYFALSSSWHTHLYLEEDVAKKEIFFNTEINKNSMDYFDRQRNIQLI